MSLISAPRQTKTGFNGGDADTQGSNSTSSEVPERKAGGLKRVKSPTKIFKSKKKEESPALRQPSLAINIDAADGALPYDIGNLTDSDFTDSLSYLPQLATLVSSGGRSKRWAFCLTPTPVDPHGREKGGISRSDEEESRPPTLYLVLAPDQDLSRSSEVVMLVGTKEELRSKTGGGDVF